MKVKITTLIAFFALSIFCTPIFAVHKSPIKSHSEVSTADAKKAQKMEKKLNKLSKKIEKKIAKKQAKTGDAEVDFDDPVDKWMWYWIFSWGIGLGFAILRFIALGTLFNFLAGLFFLAGTVFLILWLVKKFG